jgi:cyclopropane fatty-acyl-phospholipid synthase-like methyltransferase
MLGKHFEPIGDAYRRIFVDLERIVDVFSRELPKGARVLDIGGGDGALIERLLNRRPDLAVTMCDLASNIGSFLSDANRAKVQLRPATEFSDVQGQFDAVTITDVVHHVPTGQREGFFEALKQSCDRWGCRKLILKDVEPGNLRSGLAVFTDRYITGDRHVVSFSRANFEKMVRRYFPVADRRTEIPDFPNYCEVLTW